MNIEIINSATKIFFIILFAIFIVIKLLNKKRYEITEIIIIIPTVLILTIIYVLAKYYTNEVLALFILYILLSSFIKILNKNEIRFSMLIMLISMAICLMCWGISVILSFIIYKALNIKNNFVNLIIIVIIQGFLIFNIFRIKRFKKGLLF